MSRARQCAATAPLAAFAAFGWSTVHIAAGIAYVALVGVAWWLYTHPTPDPSRDRTGAAR